ncbi:MAG: hypothetical protein QW739_05435, partial [Candidatus Odinarchaeota archaeon]
NFNNEIKFFYPGLRFPAVSLTDQSCQLKCDHCNRRYLEYMKPISEYHSLVEFAKKMESAGALGALISGGCDLEGAVPLEEFLEDIRKVKKETSLVLNIHTGLIKDEVINKLERTSADIVSFEVIGDNTVIKKILHLNKSAADYSHTFKSLKKSMMKIVPHICLGLNMGLIKREFEALKIIEEFNPDIIVVIIFTPTIGTPLQNVKPPSIYSIERFLSILRILFPKSELSLGCMRPKKGLKTEIEKAALLSGVNRFVNPSSKMSKYAAEMGISVKKYYGCCSLPQGILSSFEII